MKWLLRLFVLSLKWFCGCAAWIWSLREPARRDEQASIFSVWPVAYLWDYISWNYIEKYHCVTLQAERNIATCAVVHSHCCCICANTYDARRYVHRGSWISRSWTSRFFSSKSGSVTRVRMPTPSSCLLLGSRTSQSRADQSSILFLSRCFSCSWFSHRWTEGHLFLELCVQALHWMLFIIRRQSEN
jgi:hypothetical protein